jgi:sterol 3beta-glucosyltransferase
MPGLSIRQLYRRQEATRWPFIYGFSPSVVPRPPDLERFLAAGPPPVFVGFGSRNPADRVPYRREGTAGGWVRDRLVP